MFLARDTSSGSLKIWTIEGNVSNRVGIQARTFDDTFHHLGRLRYALLQ